ncbi:MAG: hypothetical protein LQ338_005876 [Usnochroma carphineum]|nr:MAG: hypothetical protein LQ338_005876 [Usnochroma carphineum]
MIVFSVLYCLFSLSIAVATSASSAQVNTQTMAVMHNKLEAFIQSLPLPPSQAQFLTSKLSADSNLDAFLNGKDHKSSALAFLACLSAQACLGPESVEVTPVDQTEVDANWSQACRRSPYCAVLPGSAQDVSSTLKIVNFFQTKFALRSGGHSPNPGWSSIDSPGLLIDLQKLKQITVSADTKVASLGPGGRWGDVLAALDPYGVSVIGGRIPQVGVAGVILGVPTILDAFAQWQEKGASDLKSTVALIIGLETTTVGLIYSEPAEKPAAFAPFYGIPSAAVAVPATNGTVLSLTQILGTTFSNEPLRSKIDAQLYKDVYTFWREQASTVHDATGANMTFTLQPIPENLVDQGWTTLVDWQNASDDETVRAAPIATSEKWKELGEQRGSYIPFLFMNDGSRDQSPLSLYGEANVAKLKAVSQKYDPSQTFQTLQNDGFLLSKV